MAAEELLSAQRLHPPASFSTSKSNERGRGREGGREGERYYLGINDIPQGICTLLLFPLFGFRPPRGCVQLAAVEDGVLHLLP